MRRSSSNGVIVSLLAVMALGLLSLLLFQNVWLKIVQRILNASQSSNGLPVSSTPVTGLSFPTAPGPVSIGTESIVGNVGITVTGIMLPANSYVGNAARYTALGKDKEYLRVHIKVRCVSSEEKCHLTEFD